MVEAELEATSKCEGKQSGPEKEKARSGPEEPRALAGEAGRSAADRAACERGESKLSPDGVADSAPILGLRTKPVPYAHHNVTTMPNTTNQIHENAAQTDSHSG